MPRESARERRRHTWIRWVLLSPVLVIGGILTAAVVIWSAETPGLPSGRWLGAGLFGILLVGSLAENFRRSWNRPAWWCWLGAITAAHFVGYAVLFQFVDRVDRGRAGVFLALFYAEYAGGLMLLHRLGFDNRPRLPFRRLSTTKQQ